MSDYLKDLNEVQRAAVEYIDGPELIIAGAGSGKTRVLTYKIVYLINSGIKPYNILALTFTNKAAREMKERMSGLIDEDAVRQLWMGTFHSIFARILRREAELLGFPKNFTIYDTDDAKRQINEIIKEFALDTKQYPPSAVYSRISRAKNNLLLPSSYANNPEVLEQDKIMKRPATYKIYQKYFDRCKKSAAMDFDDLLLYINILFRDYPDVLEKYRNLFKYILVDEYQDTNFAQYLIVKKLSSAHGKICVVGDDSQSIYAFRGAKIENILNLQKDFEDLKIFKLEKNYRSTKNIVNLANNLIKNNKNRIEKVVYTDNETGDKIIVKKLPTDKAEAYYVAKKILELKKKNGFKFSDFAVLYRTNAQSRLFEEAFRNYSIPYRLFGAISFFQRAEIKNITAYLRLIVNKNDEQALKRIINYPKRGIGNTTIEKLTEFAEKKGTGIWEILKNRNELSLILNNRTVNLLGNFVKLIEDFTEKANELDAADLVEYVLEKSGIKREMSEKKDNEAIAKFQNVQEFVNAIRQYIEGKSDEEAGLENFLEEIALATDQDTEDDDNDKVSIMTIHASKGLEFKVVIISGLEDNLFPSFRSLTTPKELEEERRLFYVAITRSEKILIITYAMGRMQWGKMQVSRPSQFIKELDREYLFFPDEETAAATGFENNNENTIFANTTKIEKTERRKLKPVAKRRSTTTRIKEKDEKSGLQVGMSVEHSKFGKGKVLKLEGDYPDTKALVEFDTAGKKNLLLKYAKLKIL